MSFDPRVSACLSRLGGVYRDPTRVDRDASSLLKSEVGSNLLPIVAEMYENNGSKSNVLVLQGTIAIHFRGNTYQILMDIYLPAGYPSRPPVPFVRLAPNMYLKENHRHVGSDGKVYLPYLHEWRGTTHNLVELVVAISSVFSADPPVFTRRAATTTTSSTTSPRPVHAAAVAATSTTSSSQHQQHVRNPSRMEMDGGAMMTDEEAIQAALAQEAKDRAEAERRRRLAEEEAMLKAALEQEARERAEAERKRLEQEQEQRRKQQQQQEEQRRKQQQQQEEQRRNAQKEWEQQRTAQVRIQVKAKIRQELQERARKVQQTITVDIQRDLNRLHTAREQKINIPLESLKKQKQYLEQQLVVAEETKLGMQAWLDQAMAAKKQEEEAAVAFTIDDKVVPERPLHAQMMELSAENAAITDALYFLDRAMQLGHLSCEVHLKQVRQLAKRQFLVRAHLIKINQQNMEARQ